MNNTTKHKNYMDFKKMLSLLERIDPSYRRYKQILSDRQLINERDTKLKQFDRIVNSVFSRYYNLDSKVTDSTFYVNHNPNTTWREYLLFNLRHTFALMQNSDVKYIPIVARLAYSKDVQFDIANDNEGQIRTLQRIVTQLKKDDTLFKEVKDNENITFTDLYNRFSEMFAKEDAADAAEANKVQNSNSEYTIKEVPDFETANYYGNMSCSNSQLCYTLSEGTWNAYTNNGMNAVYVCLRNGWENIPEQPTEGNPYDLYGTSMIFVFVNPDGDLVTSNCRWNHHVIGEYHNDVDHAFTKSTLSKTIGMPFDSVFKPKAIDIGELIEEGDADLQEIAVGDFVIPNGVSKIGEYAFYGCRYLKSITIPNTVMEICDGSFQDCRHLSSITIPDSVTSIGEHAFYNCKNLTSITIPNGVMNIGYRAFYSCFSLTSITIPDSVTSIGDAAFAHCNGLTSITIPDSVTSIGKFAFSCCSDLTIYVFSEDMAAMVRNSGFRGSIKLVS